jgi:TolB-like protein/DNA-binding winged helix-turn-helix (wHTH) protein/Tfp pilus assembly protein PilF
MGNDDTPWSPSTSEPFRVADWTVDAPANRLLRDGKEVRLEPKVMSVLVYLAGHPGQVVSRDELEAGVWTGMVVGYDAVTNTVIKLRRALGDDARAPRIIETISKHGYRLIADVGPADQEKPTAHANAPAIPERSARTTASGRYALASVAGLLVLLLALGLVYLHVFQSSRDGREVVSAPLQPPLIAVLPFDNPTADASQEYFSNGITEDLITDLSKVSGLLVVARESAFAYKDSAEPAGRIGRELGARFLLRGSLRRQGQQLRLNVRLIDTRDERTLWAERYDRQLDDIFRIQDELTAQIVSALEVKLAPEDRRRLTRNYAASIDAYDALLLGLAHYGRRSFEDNALAKADYERAIELDPRFARAYAALALAYSRDVVDDWAPTSQGSMERAEALAEQAMQLDPNVPQIYFVRGQIALYRGKHAEAVREVEEAIALTPGYADAYALLAWVLHYAGRPAEGLDVMERAVHLNPRMPSIYRLVRGALYYALGEHASAVDDLEQAVQMNPSYQMLRLWLAAAYAGSGRIEEAQWEAAELMALKPGFTLGYVQRVYPIRDPDYRERFLTDLGKAGLE